MNHSCRPGPLLSFWCVDMSRSGILCSVLIIHQPRAAVTHGAAPYTWKHIFFTILSSINTFSTTLVQIQWKMLFLDCRLMMAAVSLVTGCLPKCRIRKQEKGSSVASQTSCCRGHYALSTPCVSRTEETWVLRWGNKLPVSICIKHSERENGAVNYLLRKTLPCCFHWQVRLQMLRCLTYAAEKTISASSLLLN